MREYICLFCCGGIMFYLAQYGTEQAKRIAAIAMFIGTILIGFGEWRNLK